MKYVTNDISGGVVQKITFGALVATALLLSACGTTKSAVNHPLSTASSTAKSSKVTSLTTTTSVKRTGTSSNTQGLPSPCSLITKSQVSSILTLKINSVNSSATQCNWIYSSNKLVAGLGSNATLDLYKPTLGETPSSYYTMLFKTDKVLNFKPITIDNLKAADGFATHEITIDTGSVIVTVAAITTIPGRSSLQVANEIATIVVKNICLKYSCN